MKTEQIVGIYEKETPCKYVQTSSFISFEKYIDHADVR